MTIGDKAQAFVTVGFTGHYAAMYVAIRFVVSKVLPLRLCPAEKDGTAMQLEI